MHKCEIVTMQGDISICWTKLDTAEETFHWQYFIFLLLKFTGLRYRQFNYS